eukprot:3073013-Rhodomonas_salina.1
MSTSSCASPAPPRTRTVSFTSKPHNTLTRLRTVASKSVDETYFRFAICLVQRSWPVRQQSKRAAEHKAEHQDTFRHRCCLGRLVPFFAQASQESQPPPFVSDSGG